MFKKILALAHIIIIIIAIYKGLQGDSYLMFPIAIINILGLINIIKNT